ncbi:wax ester/triacylglycerol synthase domain-containing protein [Flexivirga sp. B27]
MTTAQFEDRTDRERWAAAAAWSHRPTLDPVETILWRSERHPAMSATNTVVILLDEEPDWDRFHAAYDWGTALVRRLRQRVMDPAVPTTQPAWVDDDDFDLDRHVHRRDLGGNGRPADVIQAAEAIALTPIDRRHPLWDATLFVGLVDGAAACVLRIHHTMADTPGTVQLLSMLLSRTREHTPDKLTAPADASQQSAPADPIRLSALGGIGRLAGAPRRAMSIAERGIAAVRDPLGAVAESMRYAASVRRLTAAAPALPSPLFVNRQGTDWQFLTLTTPLAGLTEAARGVGGSLQDVFIAAVLGGLRRYHEEHGTEIEDLSVSVRVSLNRMEDPSSGNRFAGAMIAAPIGIVDATDRVAAVRGELLSLHTEEALDALRATAPVTGLLPSQLLVALQRSGAVADASVAVNSGPTRTSYMAGAQVTGMFAFGPLPGVAISASLLSYVDTACIAVNVDGRAVQDLDVLQRCLQEGLDETVAPA